MNKFQPPFRQSQIVDWMTCPRRFYFRHVLGLERDKISLAMFFGSVYHRAIELIHQNTFTNLLDVIDAIEAESIEPIAWGDRQADIEEWKPDAESILSHYWDKEFNRKAHILHSEICFRVNVGPFPFVGRIDELRIENGLVLIDYKSGAVPDNQTFRDLDYQLSLYAYACAYGEFWHPLRDDTGKILMDDRRNYLMPTDASAYFKIGGIPDRIAIYKLGDHLPYKRKTTKDGITYNVGDERGPARYWTTRTEADFEAMKRDLGFICRQIVGPHYGTKGLVRGGAFARTPINFGGMQTCAMCPFQAECLADRSRPIAIDEQTADEARIALAEVGITE